jgi:hypothetical protein
MRRVNKRQRRSFFDFCRIWKEERKTEGNGCRMNRGKSRRRVRRRVRLRRKV